MMLWRGGIFVQLLVWLAAYDVDVRRDNTHQNKDKRKNLACIQWAVMAKPQKGDDLGNNGTQDNSLRQFRSPRFAVKG